MNFSVARWIGSTLASISLLACGGGGGNPGVCLGSALVCSTGSNLANTSAPAPAAVGPVALPDTVTIVVANPNAIPVILSNTSSTSTVTATTLNSSPAAPGIPSSATVANRCTINVEQQFTQSYLNEAYLWYSEVPAIAAGRFNNVKDHFYASLTPVRDSTGALKDRFSFIVPTAEADTIATGANVGYGADWARDSAGLLRVTQVAPGSPADLAGMARGGQFVRLINTNTNTTTGNPLFPNQTGAFMTFSYRNTPALSERTITLNAVSLVDDPVPQNKVITTSSGKRVGYVQFDAHTRGAQDKLITTMQSMKTANLDTMVLDLRYNGGGFIYTALSLATMLSGPSNENKVFERLQFNDKRPNDTADSTYTFMGALQFGEILYPENFALPRLALSKLYILTTGNTCSASESVINSLRGVDVEVVLVGDTTCGKPYGFSRKDNCGNAYFPIEFVGTNHKGFGDYAHGFSPTCPGTDDLDHPLGNASERLLSIALGHFASGSCPIAISTGITQSKARDVDTGLRDIVRPKMPGRLHHPAR